MNDFKILMDILELMYGSNPRVEIGEPDIKVQGYLGEYLVSLATGKVMYKGHNICIEKIKLRRDGSVGINGGYIILSEPYASLIKENKIEIDNSSSVLISTIDYLLNDKESSGTYNLKFQIEKINNPTQGALILNPNDLIPTYSGTTVVTFNRFLGVNQIIESEISRAVDMSNYFTELVAPRDGPRVGRIVFHLQNSEEETGQSIIDLEPIRTGFRVTREFIESVDALAPFFTSYISDISDWVLNTFINSRKQRGRIGECTPYNKRFDGLIATAESRRWKSYNGAKSKPPVIIENLDELRNGIINGITNIETSGFDPNVILVHPSKSSLLFNIQIETRSEVSILSSGEMDENKMLLYDKRYCIIGRTEPTVTHYENLAYDATDYLIRMNIGYAIADPRALQLLIIKEE